MKKLKVGMISFAHGHAFSYLDALLKLPQVEVVGIADEVKSRVDEVVTANGLRYYEDYKDLLADGEMDAVVICSENIHQAKLTIDSAQAGKHVICEKPLGISVDEMERMIAVCRDNEVKLFTAFPCRYIAPVIDAKAAIDRGDIGKILTIKGTNRGSMPGGWFVKPDLSGGGALLTIRSMSWTS